MEKIYEEPKVAILVFEMDIVKTSTGKDPFDDDYSDFGDNK